MKPPRQTTAYFIPNDAVFCPGVFHVSHDVPIPLHTQDFAEIFWVESGRGTHLINGGRQALTPGTVVLVRPTDCHGFCVARGLVRLRIFTILIKYEVLEFFRQHYFPKSTTFFWTTARQAFTAHFSADEFKWLITQDQLSWSMARSDRLMLDRFLLELFCKLRADSSTVAAPLWMQQALVAVRQPQHFRGGTSALARLAGRTPQRVNQILQEYYRLTATAVVNRARMEYAAQELIHSEKKIVDICEECGFHNLGHFYRVFEAHHKTTPRLYRQQQHTLQLDGSYSGKVS